MSKVRYITCLSTHPSFELFAECTRAGIDSRLKGIFYELEDVSDSIDRKLGWKRYTIWLKSPNDLAVYMYRLDSMALDGNEDAAEELRLIFRNVLKVSEDAEPYMLDTPGFLRCPECSTLSDNMEVQDQVWVCYDCGWQGNFQSEWPYVMNELNMLGRLDLFVAQRLKAMDESPDDDQEGELGFLRQAEEEDDAATSV